jgi:hypothetical protein
MTSASAAISACVRVGGAVLGPAMALTGAKLEPATDELLLGPSKEVEANTGKASGGGAAGGRAEAVELGPDEKIVLTGRGNARADSTGTPGCCGVTIADWGGLKGPGPTDAGAGAGRAIAGELAEPGCMSADDPAGGVRTAGAAQVGGAEGPALDGERTPAGKDGEWQPAARKAATWAMVPLTGGRGGRAAMPGAAGNEAAGGARASGPTDELADGGPGGGRATISAVGATAAAIAADGDGIADG